MFFDYSSQSASQVVKNLAAVYLNILSYTEVTVTLAELLMEQLKTQRKLENHPKNQQPFHTQSMDDLISFLDGPHLDDGESFVCAVVNNIDGPALRDSESQQYLARLAASTDHVNAPLLWNKKMVHKECKWYGYLVPTYAPYKVEGIFFSLILAHSGSAQTVKTASIVLQSLTLLI
ncbi:hypothetical protein SASPL_145235 [Salvia splendens]|uniref:Origin recognition complex subunit 2 n=1 Tax=Salvia splendens TaxID=180675 RepID=A0A8X8Z7H4_SALSN|nr:hypothetical protein SASPL_145235 [Salvia splendens]